MCCLALQIVLREFLNPRGWKPSEDTKFFLDAEQINQLCDVAEQIFQAEPSVLRLKGTDVSCHQGSIKDQDILHCISHLTSSWADD